MPQYIGFSTIDACMPKTTNPINSDGINGGPGSIPNPLIPGKKFRLCDSPLVLRDFINALNIPLGSKVGQPGYGTSLWDFLFEPNTADLQLRLQNELIRVASLDPRLILNSVRSFPKEHGILVELQLAINPFNQPQLLSVFFNGSNNTAIPV